MTGTGAEPRRRPVRGWIIFVLVAVVAIAAGGITGRVLWGVSGGTGPSDTVLRFFTALSTNDAQGALAELATTPANTSFITDGVLAAAHAKGAIADINVPATNSTLVPVSYTLAGEPVTDRISVEPVGNGYKISTALNSGGISLKDKIRAQLPLTMAGQAVDSDTIVLLPGVYPLTTVTDQLQYGTGTIVIKHLTDTLSSNDLKVSVTDSGKASTDDAVIASLAACVAQKSFAPEGCPFSFSVPGADPATVSWTLLSRPADDLMITVSPSDISQSTVEVPLSVRITYVSGTATVTQDLPTIQAVGTVDLLADPVTVAWTT